MDAGRRVHGGDPMMKAKELISELCRRGGRIARTRGDHVYVEMPDGGRVMVPKGGTQSEVSVGCWGKAKRYVEEGDEKRPAAKVAEEKPRTRTWKAPMAGRGKTGADCPKCSRPGAPIRTERTLVAAGTLLLCDPVGCFAKSYHIGVDTEVDRCVRCRTWYPPELGGRGL